MIESSVSHHGEGFTRKSSMTLGPSLDEGNRTVLLSSLGMLSSGLASWLLEGLGRSWATFTDQGGEGLGCQGSGKAAIDINHGQGLQTHMFQGPERVAQSGGVCG